MSTGAKPTVQYRVEELSAFRKFPFGKNILKNMISQMQLLVLI